MLKGFKEFIARGNAVDLAVAVVIGAAFGTVITALVDGIINPLVGLILPGSVDDLGDMSFSISGAEFFWGSVVSALLTFVIIAAAIYFLVVVPINHMNKRRAADTPEDEKSNEDKMVELLEQIAAK